MDELYELTLALEEARRRELECRAQRDMLLRRNILLEDENHRLRQLIEAAGIELQ